MTTVRDAYTPDISEIEVNADVDVNVSANAEAQKK